MSGLPPGVTITPGFAEAERPVVASLYWQAFGAKLGRVLGPDRKAREFLTVALDPRHALCARDGDGGLLGVAGFKTFSGGLVDGGLRRLVGTYGTMGASWRMVLLAALGNDIDNRRFLIDGLFVAPDARGRGIGTALILALEAEARRRGHDELRLEVIDENIRARALYERLGFAVVGRHRLGFLRWVFGFRGAATMVRVLP
ncbi:MAG: GNAT family N-acetyltransferase [Rubellimicrobium sp.]|nr:GNAT family N-acetyltransferase [Rubellimicrobium sp.]